MRKLLFVGVCAATLGGGAALADCTYAGYTYGTGATICFDGWLQECTVDGYWKAIGSCKAPDQPAVESLQMRLLTLVASDSARRIQQDEISAEPAPSW